MRLLPALLFSMLVAYPLSGQTYNINTFAGGGLPENVRAESASLVGVNSVAVDGAGNLFLCLSGYAVVLRIDAATGALTRVAGNGTQAYSGDNGPAPDASLNNPSGVAVDSAGDIYIADTMNYRVRKVSIGVIATVAGGGTAGLGDNGPATSAQLAPFGSPWIPPADSTSSTSNTSAWCPMA